MRNKYYSVFIKIIFISFLLSASGSCSLFFPYNLTVKIEPEGAGTVTVTPDRNFYKRGEPVTLTAESEGEYYFAGWQGDYSGNRSTAELIMDSDKEITAVFTKVERKAWTLMIYLDTDNNLELAGIVDFNEMEKGIFDAINSGNGDITDNLNLIVLMDRTEGESSQSTDPGGGDWTETRLYRIRGDNDPIAFGSERLDDGQLDLLGHVDPLGEKNMGSPATLSWFIDYCNKWFPADNRMLVLWNHGSGARAVKGSLDGNALSLSSVKAIAEDVDNGGDILYLDEVQQALKKDFNAQDKLDILGFDACLMQTVEVGYEIRDLVRYMVGSMYLEQGNGWPYHTLLGKLTGTKDESLIDPPAMATHIVEVYRDYIENTYSSSQTGETMSAVDLSKMGELKSKIDALAVKMAAAGETGQKGNIEKTRDGSVHFYIDNLDSIAYPYYDLYDLCSNIKNDTGGFGFSQSLKDAAGAVITTLSSAVVYAYGDDGNGQSSYLGTGSQVNRGLSIFFSRGDLIYDGYSHYACQWWYTSEDTKSWAGGDVQFLYGHIDFCDSNANGTVESWREFMEKWYDDPAIYSNQYGATPSTW